MCRIKKLCFLRSYHQHSSKVLLGIGNDRIEFYVIELGDHETFCKGPDNKYNKWL